MSEDLEVYFQDLANNIKALRKSYDLTQKEMAAILEMDSCYYARLERGKESNRKFTLEHIFTICSRFKVTPNDLLTKLKGKDDLKQSIIDELDKLTFEELVNLKMELVRKRGDF